MIEIKISGNTPLEAMASLTAFGFRCMLDPEVHAAATRIYEAEKKAEEKKAEEKKAPVPPSHGPQQTAPAVEENPTQPPAPPSTAPSAPTDQSQGGSAAGASPEPITPSDPAKVPTLEEVRDIGIKYGKQYGTPAIKAILNELGASGMGALAENQRSVFLEKLAELGPLKEDENDA